MRKLSLRLPRDRANAANALRYARSLLEHGPLARTAAPVYNLASSIAQQRANTIDGPVGSSYKHVAWMLAARAERAAYPSFEVTDAALERIAS